MPQTCDELDINGFLTNGQLKNLLPKIMQPGTLTKSGATITLPQFKIKQKFDLKDSLSQVWKCYMFYWYILGWAQWNLSSLEFKFDDAKLSS